MVLFLKSVFAQQHYFYRKQKTNANKKFYLTGCVKISASNSGSFAPHKMREICSQMSFRLLLATTQEAG